MTRIGKCKLVIVPPTQSSWIKHTRNKQNKVIFWMSETLRNVLVVKQGNSSSGSTFWGEWNDQEPQGKNVEADWPKEPHDQAAHGSALRVELLYEYSTNDHTRYILKSWQSACKWRDKVCWEINYKFANTCRVVLGCSWWQQQEKEGGVGSTQLPWRNSLQKGRCQAVASTTGDGSSRQHLFTFSQ